MTKKNLVIAICFAFALFFWFSDAAGADQKSKAEKDLVDVAGILIDDEGEAAPPKPGDL